MPILTYFWLSEYHQARTPRGFEGVLVIGLGVRGGGGLAPWGIFLNKTPKRPPFDIL